MLVSSRYKDFQSLIKAVNVALGENISDSPLFSCKQGSELRSKYRLEFITFQYYKLSSSAVQVIFKQLILLYIAWVGYQEASLGLILLFEMRNWKNQKFLLCKLDYSAISGYFFPNFSNHKTNLRDFSSFISLVVGLFCFKSQWKLFILKAVHASIRPFFSLFKYLCRSISAPDIQMICQ